MSNTDSVHLVSAVPSEGTTADSVMAVCAPWLMKYEQEIVHAAVKRLAVGAHNAGLEQAATLVELEYAADATQGRRLALIARHIRNLKKQEAA